jgi:hypothetical protein
LLQFLLFFAYWLFLINFSSAPDLFCLLSTSFLGGVVRN